MLIFASHREGSQPLPLVSSAVRAGFPSPADDYVERQLDLNEFLVPHPAATFFARVEDDAMHGMGVRRGDYLVIDRSRIASHGSLVLAVRAGEFLLRRLRQHARGAELWAAHPDYPPIALGPDEPLQVWGVVTAVIRKLH